MIGEGENGSPAHTEGAPALFARLHRLGTLLTAHVRSADGVALEAVAGVPLRGPVRAILEADQRRRLRTTRRLAVLIRRHTRASLRAFDRDAKQRGRGRDSAGRRRNRNGHGPAAASGEFDRPERQIRIDAINWALDQLAARLSRGDGQATGDPARHPAEEILQNELPVPSQAERDTDKGPPRADHAPPLRQQRDIVRPATRPDAAPPMFERGTGTLDDPLIRPTGPRLATAGTAPGRIVTVVIDAHSPPLFGPARQDWFEREALARARDPGRRRWE